MSETVEHGKFVSFHFTMYAMDGDILGSTEDAPMSYIHGVTPFEPIGLAEFLEGKIDGFFGEVVLPPEKAYGEALASKEDSIAVLPLDAFPYEIVPGMTLMAQIGDQGELPLTIMDIRDDQVMVHYGHPLAGHSLRFEVTIVEVRDPTPEDIDRFQNTDEA
jgi:FKBP-type peptidyl-prolyl cis-trans isomerase SlyD